MNVKEKLKLYKYQIFILTLISFVLFIPLNAIYSYIINFIIPFYPNWLIKWLVKLNNSISSFINGYEIAGLIIVLVVFLITRKIKNRQKLKPENIIIRVIILSLYFILINLFIYFYYPIYPTIPTNNTAFNYKPSQEFLNKHNRMFKTNNPDIQFSISTLKKTYFIGEAIEIEMLFKNISKKEYKMSKRNYDRSGRMSDVSFYGEGSDGLCEDPRGLYPCVSGGMGSCEKVTENKRKFLLNKWIIFRKPGKYYIYSSNGLLCDHNTLVFAEYALYS